MRWIRALTTLFSTICLIGCVGSGYAPVVRLGTAPQRAPHRYVVQQGDTLYSIAWQYGLDYHQIAANNHLASNYAIYPGQHLMLKGKQLASSQSSKTESDVHLGRWGWPTKGKIIQGFKSGYGGNAGIDIAGKLGQPVVAAQSGTVVYSGNGVRGYGNLIIMKNSGQFLSAYAFNQRNLVSVGHHVKRGQRIAVMGSNNAGQPVLHFEIRHAGQPVDPMKYLH